MADLIPVSLYTRAAEQTIATLKRSPWIVAVPMVALGLGTLADWLLAPMLNVGLIIAAPLKAVLWASALYVWRRTLLEGSVDSAEVEAELMARAKSFTALAVPLLFGTLAFLTLAWGGALAGLFVLLVVLTPLLEASLLGAQSSVAAFFRQHGQAWAVSQLAFTSVLIAVWLVVVMVAGTFHVFAGEVASAVIGGPLLTVLWLVRGHAWMTLDAPPVGESVAPALPKKAPVVRKTAPARRPPSK